MIIYNNNSYNRNDNKKETVKGKKEENIESSTSTHTQTLKKLHKSLANFIVYFLDIHRNLTVVRKGKKILWINYYICTLFALVVSKSYSGFTDLMKYDFKIFLALLCDSEVTSVFNLLCRKFHEEAALFLMEKER